MSVGPDRVLVVIGRTRHKMIAAELQEAVKRGGKFIELRLDFLAKAVEFKRMTPYKQCPWVATLRRPADGGRFPGTEAERQTVLRQAIVSTAFEWVDLEHDVAKTIPRFGPVKRIVSYHNLVETPDNLEDIYADMLKLDGDVYKLAVMAQTPADVARILRLQQSAPKPTIAFGMGDIGAPSRYLSLKYGAPWIYAAFNKERGIAPGLPSLEEFRTTYPVRSIDAATRVFGVAGDPVGQSLSPVLHNHVYKRLKLNAIYLPFRIPRGQFQQGVEEYAAVPVEGYSVTIPHKEAAAAVAREKEPTVDLTGAANTLVRLPDGKFSAANTDYHAALDAIKDHLKAKAADGPVTQLNQCAVLVLGAGGAARAICHALHKEGAHITIAARTPERAHALAEEVNCKTIDWHARHSIFFDILINCTPVGMHPNVDETPVHVSVLKPGVTVFDTVYNPETTLLIREAKARGCDTITGVEMFVRQAARQVELFTGQTPDVELMRTIVRKALSPLTRALDTEDEEKPAEGDAAAAAE
jgi:3-dehydroquinate dehydratase/shikimate dehydrogenase